MGTNTGWSICYGNNICCSGFTDFLYLDGKNVLQQKLSEIKTDFLKEGKENYTVKKQFVSVQRHFPVCLL